MVDEKSLFERIGDGAIPGTVAGFSIGAARAYLESRTVAEKSAEKIATAMSAKTPPSAAALRALKPKPLPALFATTAVYAALGGTYTGVEAIAEGMREKKDMWNKVIGGAAAGSLVGLRTGSVKMSAMASFTCAFVAFFIEAAGGTLGPVDDPSLARREAIYKAEA